MRWEFEHASSVRKRAREQIQRSRVLTQTLIIPHNRQTTQSQVQAAQSLLRNVKDGERLGQTRKTVEKDENHAREIVQHGNRHSTEKTRFCDDH